MAETNGSRNGHRAVKGSFKVKAGLAQMLKGGVIMDVVTPEHARIAQEAGTASDAYLARRTMAPLLDVLEEMDMLARLHRDGLLSDDEFASKRTQVLERL